ncbi:MAG: molybdopterin-binding protein [Burkholderiales bacterium]
MNFGLIIVGDEILSGKRQDKHLAKTIELLAARGLALAWARYVGDEPARLITTLRDAMAGGDAVFSCGGIGATPDDHTRQCAAAAAGVALLPHAEAQALILARVRRMAAEQGRTADPAHPDNLHRLNMGLLPAGAHLIPNPYNQIPGFSVGEVHFLPGFPVMAHPMIEWVLDTRYAHLHGQSAQQELSVIASGAMEAALTPLMQEIEARFEGVRVFSLPSVDHPQWGRHIELGVKGRGDAVQAAYQALRAGLSARGVQISAEVVR